MADWENYQSTDTLELVKILQDSKSLQPLKDNVFLALCFRFRERLLNNSEIICKNRGYNNDVAIEIVDNTFRKFYKSNTFRHDSNKESDVDTQLLLYFFGIAKNELNNYYKMLEKKKNGLLYTGYEEIVTSLPSSFNSKKLSGIEKMIHETIISMPYSHQVIYYTYKTHERDGVNLPQKLQEKLRDHLGGISQNTVRSYKKEVIDKINSIKNIFETIKQ